MKKRLLLVAVAVCLTSVTAHAGFGGYSKTQDFRAATPEELAMKNVPGDAGAEAAILASLRATSSFSPTSSRTQAR